MFHVALTFLLVGMAIRVAIRLAYGSQGASSSDPIYFTLQLTKWIFLGLAGITGFVLLTGVFSVLLVVLLIATSMIAIGKMWSIRRKVLLSTIAISVEKGLPLPGALHALADETSASNPHTARQLARLLESGMPLSSAVERLYFALPDHVAAFLQVGDVIGDPGAALREASTHQSAGEMLWHAAAGRLLYISAVVLYLVGIGTFCMVKIVPSLSGIFADYQLQLPPLTQAIISASQLLTTFSVLSVFVIGVLVLLVLALGCAWVACQLGWIRAVPLATPMMTHVHRANVLRALALAAERGAPMYEALHALGKSYPRPLFRRRLRQAVTLINEGCHWCESLYAAKLIGRADTAVLQSAERVGNVPWALRATADSGIRRLVIRLQWFVYLLTPCIILALGVAVLLFVVGLFLPLVELITGMT